MPRKQEIALFTNSDGTTGYQALGTETAEEATARLKKEKKKYIVVFEATLVYWSA